MENVHTIEHNNHQQEHDVQKVCCLSIQVLSPPVFAVHIERCNTLTLHVVSGRRNVGSQESVNGGFQMVV